MTTTFDELGCFLLSQDDADPARVIPEARRAEGIGLGSAFVAEQWRMNIEAASVCGAALAATDALRIGTAATNHNVRHPTVTAAWAASLDRISGGRCAVASSAGCAIICNPSATR